MNPEIQAWQRLNERAAAQLHPNFADRVLRSARAGIGAAPSLLSQATLSAVTAALCLLAVVLFQTGSVGDENNRSIADWQQIASAADDPGAAQ